MDQRMMEALPLPEDSLCFTGHRRIPAAQIKAVRFRLENAIRKAADEGIRNYLCGGALGFDTLAAEEVLCLRDGADALPVRLVLALPCRGQDARWYQADRLRYQSILARADQTIYLAEQYDPGCMHRRNRFLVDHASRCVCWLYALKGGTWSTVRYAWEQGVPILNLAMPAEDEPRLILKEGTSWSSICISPSAGKNAPTAILPPLPVRRNGCRHILKR